MKLRTVIGAIGLLSCGLALTAASGCATLTPGSQAPVRGAITVEAAYDAAATAATLFLQRPQTTPAQAAVVRDANRKAYRAICYARTAYDMEEGRDPAQRGDGCPEDTRTGPIPRLADAVSRVVGSVRELTSAATPQ